MHLSLGISDFTPLQSNLLLSPNGLTKYFDQPVIKCYKSQLQCLKSKYRDTGADCLLVFCNQFPWQQTFALTFFHRTHEFFILF